MKLTTAQILAFKARYENRFDDEVITAPGLFKGMTVKVAQQVLVNLGEARYVDWLIDNIQARAVDKAIIDQVYDEYFNDPTYAWYAVQHYVSLQGSQIKERVVQMEQPPVDTYDIWYSHRKRYGYLP